MAYILAVNPQILSLAGVKGATSDMKMDQGAIFVATALAAFVGSLFMGLIAKYPIALAPGMGLNAFFAYSSINYGNSLASGINRCSIFWYILCITYCYWFKRSYYQCYPSSNEASCLSEGLVYLSHLWGYKVQG